MISTLLVATDFSSAAEQALDHGRWLAERLGARLVLLHAGPSGVQPTAASGAPAASSGAAAHLLQAQAAGGARDAARLARAAEAGAGSGEVPGAAPELLLVDASPAEAILSGAETVGADWIVMGTRGHGGLGQLLLGSVASEVVRRARCPVTLIGPNVQRSSVSAPPRGRGRGGPSAAAGGEV